MDSETISINKNELQQDTCFMAEIDYKAKYEELQVKYEKLQKNYLKAKTRIKNLQSENASFRLNTISFSPNQFGGVFDTKSDLTRHKKSLLKIYHDGDYFVVRKDGSRKGLTTQYRISNGEFVFAFVVC